MAEDGGRKGIGFTALLLVAAAALVFVGFVVWRMGVIGGEPSDTGGEAPAAGAAG